MSDIIIEFQQEQGISGVSFPAGGTTGQVLAKNSNTNNDVEWVDPISGSGDVIGPNSSIDGNIVLFDGITGKLIKDSLSKISDLAPALGTDDNYVTDAEKTILSNTSNTNSGDETNETIKTKLGTASTSTDGYLTSTDWNTFNSKQPAGNYSTLTGSETLTNKVIDSSTNRIGADHIHIKIKNLTGSTIANGVLIKAVGYESGDECIRVAPVSSINDVAIGITHGSLANGVVGLAVNTGLATGINTSGLAINTVYYSNGSGGLTATKPTSGYYQAVAVTLDTKVDGSLLVEFTEPKPVNWDDRYYTETETDNLLNAKESIINKGVANGYASLDNSIQVLKAQLGTGTPDGTKFLRGDGTWSVPAGDGTGIGSIPFVKSNGTQDDIDISTNTTMTTLGITGDLLFDSNADIQVGGGFGWRDLFSSIEARGGATAPTWTLFRNGIYLYAFAANQMKEVFATYHIDHDYAIGTNAYPHLHFTTNTTSSGVVRIGFEYTVAKGHQQASGSVYSATTTVYKNITINGAPDQYKHFIAEVDDIDVVPSTLLEPDTVILMRIFRDAANVADTYPDVIFGIQADLHYQIGKFATKNKSPNFYT